MPEFYIGLMSGTSADGIDAALVDFSSTSLRLIETAYLAYSNEIREKIFSLTTSGENEIERMAELDVLLAKTSVDIVKHLLKKAKLTTNDIVAIGSHGQTIRHYPNHRYPFTVQISDPNIIAAETRITTIADFRRKDIAFGGQGAPLVPAFHCSVMPNDQTNRVIVNIGGIANVTILTKNLEKTVVGFDTGPGNVLLDSWIFANLGLTHDEKGNWSATGTVHQPLLSTLLNDVYFSCVAPKSTGREYFNLHWLQKYLTMYQNITPNDVQTTLVELTALTILHSVQPYFTEGEMLICGGGAQNHFLMTRLIELSKPHFNIATTEKYGIHPDWMEATAFAWLAYQTMHKKPGNLPSVTGATNPAILGGIYYGTLD